MATMIYGYCLSDHPDNGRHFFDYISFLIDVVKGISQIEMRLTVKVSSGVIFYERIGV
jgi:hypothetical protein